MQTCHCFCNCKSACRSEVQRSAVFINKYRTIGLYICGQLPISRIRNINYYFCLILTISHSVNGLSCILFCNSVGILSDCIICDLSESKRTSVPSSVPPFCDTVTLVTSLPSVSFGIGVPSSAVRLNVNESSSFQSPSNQSFVEQCCRFCEVYFHAVLHDIRS